MVQEALAADGVGGPRERWQGVRVLRVRRTPTEFSDGDGGRVARECLEVLVVLLDLGWGGGGQGLWVREAVGVPHDPGSGSGFGFRVSGSRIWVLGSRVRVPGSGFRSWGFGFRVEIWL